MTSSHSYELPYVDSVVNDDEDGTRQATEHLIGLGHQRIAHIGGGPDGVPRPGCAAISGPCASMGSVSASASKSATTTSRPATRPQAG